MLVYTRRDSLAENRAMCIDRFLRILEILTSWPVHGQADLHGIRSECGPKTAA